MNGSDTVIPKVIYIASSSRSGSTLLDQSLGAVDGVCGVGELRRLRDFATLNARAILDPANRLGCTCGAKVLDCEFWKEVERRSGLDMSKALFSSQLGSANRALFKTAYFILGVTGLQWLSRYYRPFRAEIGVGENCFRLYAAVAAITGAEYIVDSSKMVHQFILLKTARSSDMYLVALFRNGKAVAKSMTRGERARAFEERGGAGSRSPLAAAVSSWVKTSLQILLCYATLPKAQRYLIRYENFCADPESHRAALLAHFGKVGVKLKADAQQVSHNIGGSPSRFHYDASKVAIDSSWQAQWTCSDDRTFGIWGTLINKLLGYH